jgi:hypothetical protein
MIENDHQLKLIADTAEATRVEKQADYEAAIIEASEAAETLRPILRNDDLRDIRFSWTSFQHAIYAKQVDVKDWL